MQEKEIKVWETLLGHTLPRNGDFPCRNEVFMSSQDKERIVPFTIASLTRKLGCSRRADRIWNRAKELGWLYKNLQEEQVYLAAYHAAILEGCLRLEES